MNSSCEWCLANWVGYGNNWCWVLSTSEDPQPIEYGLTGASSSAPTGTAPAYSQPPPSCPNGYGMASNQCTLSDARAASPDGRVDYSRAPGATTISPASSNDADKNNTSVPVRSNADGSVTATGRGSGGNMEAITIRPLVGGGTAVTKYYNNGDGTVTAHVSGYDGTGTPLNYTRTYTPGNLSYNQTTGATTIESAPSTISTPDGTGTVNTLPQTVVIGGTGAAAPSTPIEFPSDYSREVTQASIDAKLGHIKDGIASTQETADPTLPGVVAMDDVYFKNTFTNLLSWNLPAHSSQCPAPSFDWNNASYTLDTHCQLAQNHFTTFQSVMSVIWLILAMFIVLGA